MVVKTANRLWTLQAVAMTIINSRIQVAVAARMTGTDIPVDLMMKPGTMDTSNGTITRTEIVMWIEKATSELARDFGGPRREAVGCQHGGGIGCVLL
jgi:hypothetical protein